MKIGVGAMALGLLLPVAAGAREQDLMRRGDLAPVSAAGAALSDSHHAPHWMPPESAVCEGPSAWGPFRHGDLWADYCEPAAPCVAAPSRDSSCRPWWPFAGRRVVGPPLGHPVNCTRCAPFGRLYELLGWRPRWYRHAVGAQRICAQESRGWYRIDDQGPAPDPSETPAPTWATPDEDVSLASPDADVIQLPVDQPALTAPLPSDALRQDPPPSAPRELATPPAPARHDGDVAPAPTDDPAPEPPPDIPRNTLPALKRPPSASPTPYRPTAVAGRLSDFIRVR